MQRFSWTINFKLSISVIFLKTLIILIVVHVGFIIAARTFCWNGNSRHFRDVYLQLAEHFFASSSHLLGCGRVQASNSPVVLLGILVKTLAHKVYFGHDFPTAVYIVAEPQIVRVHVPWYIFWVGGRILADRFFDCTQRLKLTYRVWRTACSALTLAESWGFNFNSLLLFLNLILELGRLSLLFFL
jgi:hypothetical protein